MKLRYTRILSLLLCAALACSILAGCGGSTASRFPAPQGVFRSAKLCQQFCKLRCFRRRPA